jgi:hypothetical protein
MRAATKIRVAHPFAHFAKGWGIARSATALLFAALALSASAEGNTCRLSGIRHSAQLAYPMIAMAAHVTGDVTMLAHIAADGSVTSVDAVGGPEMLKDAARKYVSSWQTNEADGEQVCPVVISFQFEGIADCYYSPSAVTMSDLQHFIVKTNPIQTCDPMATITFTRYRFLFFRWNSKPVRHVNE